ncbi:tail fiber domain-containing protein [Streptomyces rectiverticillatus]|uniref:tail fiber domain-containing protein n=1 Tax=Streptomyces rectiverticillatus TaxID=173860 RepID=UPI0031B5AE3D
MVVTPAGLRRAVSARRRPASLSDPAVSADGAVHGFDVLRKVVEMPVSTWRYRSDPPGVRHLGPMAQDWWAAFGLGDSDRRISPVDANGVALVCVQALHRLLVETQKEVGALRGEVARLRAVGTGTNSRSS